MLELVNDSVCALKWDRNDRNITSCLTPCKAYLLSSYSVDGRGGCGLYGRAASTRNSVDLTCDGGGTIGTRGYGF
jgi:hypothetical protein